MPTVRTFVLLLLALLSPAVGPTLAAPATFSEQAVAVIVGNRSYPDRDVPDVDFAHNDADAIRRYVEYDLGIPARNIIDLRDTSLAELTATFGSGISHKGDLWRRVREGRSDVLVFYSGHGMPDAQGRGYLLPVDARPARAEVGGYPLELLYRNLAALNARSVLVLIDACFSGSSHAGSLTPASSGFSVVAEPPPPPPAEVTVLTAAGPTQIASWDLEAEHGLFTAHLLKALAGAADSARYGGDGDGRIALAEIRAYLDDEMTYAAKRSFGREQDASLTGEPGRQLPAASLRPEVGDHFRDCDVCPEMIVVPAGDFPMGSPVSEDYRHEHEGPMRQVRIAEAFAVGVHQVSVEEYAAFAEATGRALGGCYEAGEDWELREGLSWLAPGFPQSADHPVVCVSFDDAEAYVSWLSSRTDAEYRLLSEAEWEYVARSGTRTRYWWGEDPGHRAQCRYANGADASAKARYPDTKVAPCSDGYVYTAPVGSFDANRFGVHDMAGNVFEWVKDCWHGSYRGALLDGSPRLSGDCDFRVLRGASWNFEPRYLRVAGRVRGHSGSRFHHVGFRVARPL